MDNWERFLDDLGLSERGVFSQIASFSSIFFILISAVLGMLILIVYLYSYKYEKINRSFILTIPIISILMTVLMRMKGTEAVVFFGIFGVLSIVRFRSSTEQRDIPFILFAVINGVLVGTKNFILAGLAFLIILVVIGIIAIINKFKVERVRFLLTISSNNNLNELHKTVITYFKENKIKFTINGINQSIDKETKFNKNKIECTVVDNALSNFFISMDKLREFSKQNNFEFEFKKR